MEKQLSLAATLLTIGLYWAGPATAGDPQQQIEQLQQQVEAMEGRLQALEQRWKKGIPLNRALQIEPEPGGWRNPKNWDLLAAGMPNEEVIRILGNPEGTRTIKKFVYWQYGDGKTRMYMRRLKSWDPPAELDR